MNKLYFGDNLEILREYVADESVSLTYLDPPFNSNARYSVFFRTPSAERTTAQAGAFEDSWSWGEEAEKSYAEGVRLGGNAARVLDALRGAIGEGDLMAYLAMMAVRLVEIHRVLKPTGSLYLHCDPTASHYLKILLDAIFGGQNFRNEIIWKRRHGLSSAVHESVRFGNCTDTILFYAKSPSARFNPQYNKNTHEYRDYIQKNFTHDDGDGRLYQATSLTNPAYRPNLIYEYKGYKPPANGWMITKEKMEEWDKQGRIYFPNDKNGRLRRKSFADELKGMPIQNLWDDIAPLGAHDAERLGYPTQKPLALLERIISASSSEGDVVLDPFCGCGAGVHAAQKLNRQWIGIDKAVHAIKVVEARLFERVGSVAYSQEGLPSDFPSAAALAQRDNYQFQWWANYLFNPHALREHGKKGADRGIDGEIFFPNGAGRPWARMLTSVKGGVRATPAMVRDFARVLDRENAHMGLLICLRKPTWEVTRAAASLGFADTVHGQIPKLQIVAIEDWFKGWRPRLPPTEHLPSAAFSPNGKAGAKTKNCPQTDLPSVLSAGNCDGEAARHLNPRMIEGAA